jgi:uncharacterized damage-inducible protein DinB
MINDLNNLFCRDLRLLKEEILKYKNAQNLWKTNKNIANSGGNLCLHLIGNLQHFIGAQLGDTGYVRDRNMEFSEKDVSLEKLSIMIDEVIDMISHTLSKIKELKLKEIYPIEVFGKPMTIGYFLMHLSGHLRYHLGQINYHRRLLDN